VSPGGSPSRIARIAARLVAVLVFLRLVRRPRSAAPRPSEPASARAAEDPSRRDVPADRRAETLVAILLLIAAVFALTFIVVYAAGANTQLLGLSIGGALALLAAAAIVAGKRVVPQETAVEERDILLDERQTHEVGEIVRSGGEGVSRRLLLGGAAGTAGAAVLAAAATPLASLGPDLDGIHDTPWRRGTRLVDDQGRPLSADAIQVGSFYTALPEHADPSSLGAGLVVVRLPASMLHLPAARAGWAPEGILAFSKICPHAGCAISLYRYPLYEPTTVPPALTCPCHYSTFDVGSGGKVTFGPAGRALPQLPLSIDAQRNLRAAAPFPEDVGPSWWSVRRPSS
jgi:ubiquinol-cytochrome c reductase iron-sulfur subunit